MATATPISRLLGLIVGLAIAATAIVWALMLKGRPLPEAEAPMVRPLLAFTVGEASTESRRFPARVRATSEANLAFEVGGVVRDLPVVRGQRVKKDEVIAQLDLRDFESRLASAEASLGQQREEVDRRQRAFERGAATEMEMIRARALLKSAQADRDIAKKSLEDATLRAPFDGILADVFIDQFQSVAPGTRVARIQGGDGIRVEINVEAGRVALARQLNERADHAVRFDFLPDREYQATLVEFTTEADPTTQTFRAIFQFSPPVDVVILPGMTATVIERTRTAPSPTAAPLTVPVASVAFDASNAPFVWLVDDSAGGVATVKRTRVAVGEVIGEQIGIASGLVRGQRIAAAGVHHLHEGQRVRPVENASAADVQ